MQTITWNVEREPDGTFLMWMPGADARPLKAQNFAEIEVQGYPNHIVGQVLDSVYRQLKEGNKATVEVPIPPKFIQVDYFPD